ncbi:hypothetical protein [Bacteroides sp.]
MREFFIYTILFFFCFVPVAAQEVPFEGLHLDDLISVPGERIPGTVHPSSTSTIKLPDFKLLHPDNPFLNYQPELPLPGGMPSFRFTKKNNFRSYSFWKPSNRLVIRGNYFSSGALPVETHSSFTVGSDVEARYKLTNRLSLHFSANYISDRYRTPRSLYTRGVGGGVSYQLSDRFQLKTGACYQYNTVLRKWEWMYLTGLVFCF